MYSMLLHTYRITNLYYYRHNGPGQAKLQFICLTNHRKSDVWCWCSQTGRQAECWWGKGEVKDDRQMSLQMLCDLCCHLVFSVLPGREVWNSSMRFFRPQRIPPAITTEMPAKWNPDTSGTFCTTALLTSLQVQESGSNINCNATKQYFNPRSVLFTFSIVQVISRNSIFSYHMHKSTLHP